MSSPSTSPPPALTVREVVLLQALVIEMTGGGIGLRDRGLLESALARPLSGVDESYLFPEAPDRAAALLHALIQNHPFVDGNKRTATLAAALWCHREGYQLLMSDEAIVELALGIATHRIDVAQAAEILSGCMRAVGDTRV
jgi:death-on-curing protein